MKSSLMSPQMLHLETLVKSSKSEFSAKPHVPQHGVLHFIADSPGILCTISATSLGLQKIDLQLNSSFACILQSSYYEEEILAWLKNYAEHQPNCASTLPWDIPPLSPFQMAVLEEMQRVAFGETASYKSMASRVGCPLGARAVGNACNKNPLPLLIPCHRIIASDGTLGGFGYDLEIKTRLLNFEASGAKDIIDV